MVTTLSYSASSSLASVLQCATAASQSAPWGACGASLEEGERRLVGGDHPRLGAPLDGHVADGHPRLHRELADRVAAVLDDVALPAAGRLLGDQRQDEVLGGGALGQLTGHLDRHRLRPGLRQRLSGEDVLDLAGADAEGERPERPVGSGVRVAAHDGHARLRQAELRADDVDDALLDVTHRVQADAELLAVAAQRLDLQARDRVGDRLVEVGGRDVVVLGGQCEVGTPHLAAGQPQTVEGLRARHLVDEVKVDEEQIGLPVGTSYDVLVPDLLRKGPAHCSLLFHVVRRRDPLAGWA